VRHVHIDGAIGSSGAGVTFTRFIVEFFGCVSVLTAMVLCRAVNSTVNLTAVGGRTALAGGPILSGSLRFLVMRSFVCAE